MRDIIEIFDDNKKRYVAVPAQRMFSSNISDNDLRFIESALIRFADMTCKRELLLGNWGMH